MVYNNWGLNVNLLIILLNSFLISYTVSVQHYIYHRHGQCCWKRYKSTFMKRSKMKGSSQSTWTLTPRTQNDTLYTLQVYLQFQQLISSAKHACHLSTFHAAASAIQILTYRYFCCFIYRAISISLAFFGRAFCDKLKKINLVPVTCKVS